MTHNWRVILRKEMIFWAIAYPITVAIYSLWIFSGLGDGRPQAIPGGAAILVWLVADLRAFVTSGVKEFLMRHIVNVALLAVPIIGTASVSPDEEFGIQLRDKIMIISVLGLMGLALIFPIWLYDRQYPDDEGSRGA